MFTVLSCVVYAHNIWLVLLAAVLCLSGSWVTARLFRRAGQTTGMLRVGWHFLTALAAGVAIWCTHFVAMLGFYAGTPVGFNPSLTILSLLIAVIGSSLGFVLGGSRLFKFAPAVGGAVVGLAIAAMHYTGMIAYRVQGIVTWDQRYLVASILLAVGFSALALQLGTRKGKYANDILAGVLAFAIVALHFTGMTAFNVAPLEIDGAYSDPEAFRALALAVTGMAALIVAAGLASYLIDDKTRTENIEMLRQMATTDALTALPNRQGFEARLEFELSLAAEQRHKLALARIDLTRFKEINDLRGHKVGDSVLRNLGQRISDLLHQENGEFVARVGGDEFAAIFRMTGGRDIATFLEKIERVMHAPIRLEGSEIHPRASLGVSIYPDDADDAETLISNANLAMYRAKSDISRSICFYEKDMDQRVKERRAMSADLRDAIAHGQLSVAYQVQTRVSTGETLGYEALLRWEHPQLGFISPETFIPLAEESGLILDLGEWVLRTACEDAATWTQPLTVAVNLSAVQFIHADLPKLVRDVLAETRLQPSRLELELTETAVFSDGHRARHLMEQIKQTGVKVALDDFGTGYSSLDTLVSFPFDKIKIDKSFIQEAHSNPQTIAIIRAVVALGRSLGLAVLAEGIESEEQLNMLHMEGCSEGQGYLLGRPSPLKQLVADGAITVNPPRTASSGVARAH
ncbi:EAL domain-containing protein [Pseudooceanicola sediminis]|uniref:EAL domain-containing protein n=1 Tax=Pseudooceanicola sediminis TaxID=2211117 RepID=A0A399J2N7_9RHOB|nr:EAL domain-containing protein [Pseudooceanicola sediminis]KAA2313903.1 EAL domain-containing protein [Puniceibacterium sp. HSS470]RII38719.1 EAL domain-containing protein [Pseudooceanicola sediminis]|tara:strand:+ start:23870 stop:25939 length:2070 start_codon:yes stop_codon:yes gene_type:complete